MVKHWCFNFGILLVGTLVALAFTELLIRIFYPHCREHVIPQGLIKIDEELGWKLQANTSVVHISQYFSATYSTNSDGYRDGPGFQSEETAHRHRILLYGDSQVFGWGLSAEERFSDLLEKQNPNYEILNLAVPGYGLDQEVLSFKKNGMMSPNEVFFFISNSVLDRIRYGYIYKKYKPQYLINERGSLFLAKNSPPKQALSKVLYSVLGRLYTPYFLELQLAKLGPPSRASDAITENSPTTLERLVVKHAAQVANERRLPISMVIDLEGETLEAWKKLCETLQIRAIALPSGFSRDRANFFGIEDSHWNALANQKIAALLASSISEH